MALCGIKGPSKSVGEIIISHGLNRNEGRGAECVRFYKHHSLYINPYLIRLSLSAASLLVYPFCIVSWDVEGGKGIGRRQQG